MVPEMMQHLLFDDILDGDEAREEHDSFRLILERAEVELLDPEVLLAEVLADGAARAELTERLARRYDLSAGAVAKLEALAPPALASLAIAGLRTHDRAEERRRRFFELPPVPNYFFQRDPQFVVGERVYLSAMATEAREREPLLAEEIFTRHPALGGADSVVRLAPPPLGDPEHDPDRAEPTLEGGDVLVANPEVLLVGLSERTNRRGVEALGEELRARQKSFRHLIVVELPPQRSFMHLDTVFTFIDRDLCLAYLPVIEPGRAQSAHVYHVDLEAEHLTFRLVPSLLEALAEVGVRPEVVPCGGADDRIVQEREQWTDGANAFAIEPGVVVLYRRNRRTVEELANRGWRVLDAEQVAAGASVVGQGPTVVTLWANELSRARGGPRCMTMPLARASL
jgi:arginine deiminase